MSSAGAPEGHTDRGLFLLQIDVDRRDRLTGSISPLTEATTIAFDGWIDFLGAIEKLRNLQPQSEQDE
jgi:hypothetical protein